MRYTDIHAHLLPGIDDGPPSMDDTISMARAAAEAGTAKLVATPHLRGDFPAVKVEEIADRCGEVQAAIRSAGIDLQVIPGAEISLVWALDANDEQLRLASLGQRGSDLLIETPDDVSMIEQLLFQIRARGFRITLAHPERSRAFQSSPERLESLSEGGVLLEVNAEALLLPGRSRRRQLAERLCRYGHAHVVASDAHSADGSRAVFVLAAARDALVALVGPSRADWMMREAPDRILTGAPIDDPPPAQRLATRKRGRLDHRKDRTTDRRPLGRALMRSLVLLALAVTAVVSFVLVRGQQGTGAQLASLQRSSAVLNRAEVNRVLKAAPNGTTKHGALEAHCVPHGRGELRNPWQCRLTYPNGQTVGWRVNIFLSGAYLGYDQVLYDRGKPARREGGHITGCCIAVP